MPKDAYRRLLKERPRNDGSKNNNNNNNSNSVAASMINRHRPRNHQDHFHRRRETTMTMSGGSDRIAEKAEQQQQQQRRVPRNPKSEQWRRYGIARRRELVARDELEGGTSFFVNGQCPIQRYFQLSQRVIVQFKGACELVNSESPDDAYVMGHRLVTFLSEALPDHPEYDLPSSARMRDKSLRELAWIRHRMDEIALRIDEEQLNRYIANEFDPPEHSDDESSSSEDKGESAWAAGQTATSSACAADNGGGDRWEIFTGWSFDISTSSSSGDETPQLTDTDASSASVGYHEAHSPREMRSGSTRSGGGGFSGFFNPGREQADHFAATVPKESSETAGRSTGRCFPTGRAAKVAPGAARSSLHEGADPGAEPLLQQDLSRRRRSTPSEAARGAPPPPSSRVGGEPARHRGSRENTPGLILDAAAALQTGNRVSGDDIGQKVAQVPMSYLTRIHHHTVQDQEDRANSCDEEDDAASYEPDPEPVLYECLLNDDEEEDEDEEDEDEDEDDSEDGEDYRRRRRYVDDDDEEGLATAFLDRIANEEVHYETDSEAVDSWAQDHDCDRSFHSGISSGTSLTCDPARLAFREIMNKLPNQQQQQQQQRWQLHQRAMPSTRDDGGAATTTPHATNLSMGISAAPYPEEAKDNGWSKRALGSHEQWASFAFATVRRGGGETLSPMGDNQL